MSVYLSILKQWIIDPIQNSIAVPIFNPSIQTLLLLPFVLPIFNHFTTNPIKTLLLLPIILPILNQWITYPLQNYIILPIFNLLTTDPIKKFLLLPLIAFVGKQINNDLFKFVYNHLLKCIFVPIKSHICYPFLCDSYVQQLKNQTEKLKEKRDSLEQSVVETDEVTKLLSIEINEAEALIQRKEEAKKNKCLFGLCPNLKSRYQLSKEADKKASAIHKLCNKEGLAPFSSCLPLQQIVEPSVYSREALPSRMLILNQVMDALKDPTLYMIGVYGLGGVGKTTLAKEVRRKAMEEKMFKRVVMVLVSQTPDLRKIQDEIADFVDLKFDAQGVTGRASQLIERLKESKVLIILDDIWTKLELTAVGIPPEDECKGSKLLLTSRSHGVLSGEMGTKKEFSLELLREEETRSLFQMAVAAANNLELQDITIEIAKKCSGLPLLVNAVAVALGKEPSACRVILEKLSDFDDKEIYGKVHKVLESSFENLPSNEAKSLFLLCSLFGQSNIPTNHLLTYAMGLGLFKTIVAGRTPFQQARDRLCHTIAKLKTESLMLDGDMDGHVKMHDVVLDFARSIATKDQHAFFGINGNDLRQLWAVDKDCTRIVLHHNDLSELPDRLKYPKTELLSLLSEDSNLIIPDLFFKGIRKLKVLHLTGMCLVPMPSSLQFLKNLHSLYMHQCRLKDVAIIGSLKQLEFLSFEKSNIVELPRQLGELTQVKSLNLSDCSELKVIPPNILPKLSLIEELYMNRSFDKWDENSNASLMELEELRQLTTLEVGVSCPKKLPNRLFSKGLERYKILIGEWHYYWRTDKGSRTLMLTLKTNIHLEDGLQKLLRGSESLRLGEVEGMENDLYDLNEEGFPKLKHLRIQDNKAIRHIIDSTMWVSCDAFPILESLRLFGLNSLEEICHGGLGTESFRKLRTLSIVGCNKLKKLFSFSTAKNLLQLKELKVRYCDNLEAVTPEGSEDGICNPTQIEMISFPNLTILEVGKCKSLKYIFKTSTVKSLLQLKRLKIKDCQLMKEIVLTQEFEAEEKTDKIVFSKLDFLELSELPSLIRFSNGYPIEFQSLIEMKLTLCLVLKNFISNNSNRGPDNVQSLFNEMAIFPNLQTVDVSGMDNLEYIWHGQFADDDSFCKLKSLKIQKCSKLKVVFATSIRRFQRLEELELWRCSKTEVIYQMEELDGIDEVAFQLRHLKIRWMESLKRIWSEDAIGVFTFPNLNSVRVSSCGALEYVFPESIASGLLQLEELIVRDCKVEYVVGNTKSGEPYNFKWPKLKHFQLTNNRQKPNQLLPWLAKVCPNLETLGLDGINWMNLQFSEFPKGSFSKLKVVKVYSLDDVKTCVEVYGFLRLLSSLEKLVLKNSDLGEVFLLDNERAVGDEKHHVSAIVRLECLELGWLGSLKYIWKEGSFLPSKYLKTLEVSYCRSLIKIAASSISFQNLTTLHISECKKLENLVTPSTAKTMEHLTKLRVENCEMTAEIVAEDGDDAAEHEIIFKQLKSLELIKLPLNSFCSMINCTFHFPSLEQLLIQGCTGLLTIFSRGDFTTPKLQGVRTKRYPDEQHWEGNLNATIESIFTKQEELNIRGSSSSKAISPIQLQLMHNIKRINVTDSDKVRVVFDLEAESFAGLLPQLQELRLIDLPMLTQLWNKDPTGILDFSQLGVLKLDKCSSLKYAFTSSVASCLIQLRQLQVKNCQMMETIVKAEKAEERGALANKMILPSLESVGLNCLPKLSSVYSGIGILECPSLKKISLTDCPNLKDSISSPSRAQNPTDDEGRNQIQEIHQDCKMFKIPTLFCNPEKRNKIAITRLEELMIDWDLIKCIFDGNNQPDFLSKLKAFGLWGFHGKCGVLSLESFPNMEKLVLSDSLVEEIIIPGLNVGKDKNLVDANDPQAASIFQNLKRFEVCEYSRLKILVSSSLCFKNLTHLEVSKCDEMINLITSSTAKSLVLLRTMIISQCKVMQEIVRVESDEREDAIGFNQLECLELKDLPSLTCFCSGNYAFDFPNLDDMTIIRCPNMKTFSQQVLTPKLSDVETSDDYEWEGSLNNTIQKLFMNGRDEKATDGGGEDEADPKETKAEGKNEEKDGEAYVKQRDKTKEGEINEEKDGEGRRKKRRKIS